MSVKREISRRPLTDAELARYHSEHILNLIPTVAHTQNGVKGSVKTTRRKKALRDLDQRAANIMSTWGAPPKTK